MQWGQSTSPSSVGSVTVTLPKSFSNTNYYLSVDYRYDGRLNNDIGHAHGYPFSTSQFRAWSELRDTPLQWLAIGIS